MPKKRRNLENDILNEDQNDINDRTSLKNIKKKKGTNSKKLKKNLNIQLIIDYLFCTFFLFISSIMIFFIIKKIFFKKIKKSSLNEFIEQEYNNCQEYMKMIKKGILYDNDKKYFPKENPKISIILPVHNGEAFLKKTISSIQNQEFKDIEIIIIDDQSTDNSTILVEDLIKNEPRITFYKNQENKGVLFTKTRGVSLAKGKYVMIIDDDDKYLQKDAFTTLYNEAEKNNLDILGFKSISSKFFYNKNEYNNSEAFESQVIYQKQLSNLMFSIGKFGIIEKNHNIKVNHLIRTDLFLKIIKEIDIKYLNSKINYYVDFLFFFLLTRKAKSFKQINRIFYMKEKVMFSDNEKINYRRREQLNYGFNLSCFAYLSIIEILFNKTENTIEDKKIVFTQFEKLFLNNQCKSNLKNREKALSICELFLQSEYISFEDKRKINIFLNKNI